MLLKINQFKNDFFLGFKKAYNISFLPKRLDSFNSHILTRILRFIGGLSVILVLTGKSILFIYNIQILLQIFACLQITYFIFINLIKLVYGLYLMIKKPEIFEVRNSPLNQRATYWHKLFICAKYVCIGAVVLTGLLVAGLTYDAVLEQFGRYNTFIGLVADMFNNVFGQPMGSDHLLNIKNIIDATVNAPTHNFVDNFNKINANLTPKEKQDLVNIIQSIQEFNENLIRTNNNLSSTSNFLGGFNWFSFKDLYLKLKEFINKFDLINQILIVNILHSSFLLTLFLSFILGKFGNIIIDKLNIGTRFPKLANTLKIRLQFQSYYFFYLSVLGLLTIIINIIFNAYALYSGI